MIQKCSVLLFQTEVIIKDLLTTEIWKEKIFSALINMEFEPKTTFPIYMVVSMYNMQDMNNQRVKSNKKLH